MEIKEFEEELVRCCEKLDIDLNDMQVNKFYNYMNLLMEWNKKINLTAITEPKEIIIKHFVDSLTINNFVGSGNKVIDVGTGAGFPGIPLKILREDINVILLDSLNKRIKFLEEVIEKLQLKNIKAIHGRAEELGLNKQYRESFDISTSRAVANISTLSEYLIPLVKKNGKCIYMKGSDVEEELKSGKKAINVLGGKILNKEEFIIPNTDIKRTIIIVEKTSNTPEKYPRKAGIPTKSPIT